MKLVCVLALTAALGVPRAAPAQSSADTTALAGAVAELVGRTVVPRFRSGHAYLGEPTHDFDRWVTHRIMDAHRLPFLSASGDTADWVVTRGATFHGDTAAVLVEAGTRTRPRSFIHTYIETNRYIFARTAQGWGFVRREFVRGADLGDVRG